MKSILKITILIIIIITLSGCKNNNLPLLSKETEIKNEDEEISYSIEQVVLSKGFQSTEPNVEVIKKNNKVRLLVSLGILESNGVKIDKIIKRGNTINIHVINNTDELANQIAVPQIFIELNNVKAKKVDDMNFHIINENYKPLSIKLGLSEVVTKINSELKVSSPTTPTVNLLSEDDKIIWDVTYKGIFDRDNPETPLVDLSVQVDANSGETIQSRKSFISNYIDDGQVMDYIVNKYILYKKKEISENGLNESIWYYDISNSEKTMVYISSDRIASALFSPDLNNISILESTETNTDLYIIPISDVKAYKVFFPENTNPKLIRWKDKNNLYVVEGNGEVSNIYSYNLKQNALELVNSLDIDMLNLRVGKSNYLITERYKDPINSKLSYTDDFSQLRFFDFGFRPRFVDENRIGYLKKAEKEDKNLLYIYDMDKKEEYDEIDLNISNYSVLPDNNLFIVEKNHSNNDFTLYEYIFKEKELRPITKVNSDNVYFNIEKDLVYVNPSIPFDEGREIIYSINLSKLVSLEP